MAYIWADMVAFTAERPGIAGDCLGESFSKLDVVNSPTKVSDTEGKLSTSLEHFVEILHRCS
jgi:hypothetical protein